MQAIEIFKKRLELAKHSNWDIKPYKIIFMDFNMPLCDGPGAVKQIRKDYDEFMKEFPILFKIYRPQIIMYSGEAGQEALTISLQAGADDFISKPVSLDYLHK